MRTFGLFDRGTSAFLLFAVSVYTLVAVVSSRLDQIGQPQVVAHALLVDLVLTVPLVYWFAVVRRKGLPRVAVVPSMVLGVLFAGWALPAAYGAPIRWLEWGLFPLEIAGLAWMLRRVRRSWVDRGVVGGDALQEFGGFARTLIPSKGVAQLLASELSLFYYAFLAWRARPDHPSGTTALSLHRRSGQGAVAGVFLFLLIVEGFAVHLLLARWSEVLAWVFTASTAYLGLWIVADARALVLRPVLCDERGILVRAGLRFTAFVPWGALRELRNSAPKEPRQTVRLGALTQPTRWICLRSPLEVDGPFGMRRSVQTIALAPDDPALLDACARRAGLEREFV